MNKFLINQIMGSGLLGEDEVSDDFRELVEDGKQVFLQEELDRLHPVLLDTPVAQAGSQDGTFHLSDHLEEIQDMASKMWTYLTYTATQSHPWHETPLKVQDLVEKQDRVNRFFNSMEKKGISWRAYCILSFSISHHTRWRTGYGLLSQRNHKRWINHLLTKAEQPEDIEMLATLVMDFMELQVEHYKKARVFTRNGVAKDFYGKPQSFNPYTYMMSRIVQGRGMDYDLRTWLRVKFRNVTKSKLDFCYFSVIANVNPFDPPPDDVKALSNDKWGKIKDFLGLDVHCAISDGSLPKGWLPSLSDEKRSQEIVRVAADGYYYYKNGEQRLGRRHYAANKYHVISCTPENFNDFKDSWKNIKLYTKKPTWNEYKNWALHKDRWNESGNCITDRGASTTWRKEK